MDFRKLLMTGLAGWALLGCSTSASAQPAGLAAAKSAADDAGDVFPKGLPWFNSKPLGEKDLAGKVVLIDFWCYTCVNCVRTLPYLKEWHERYARYGLVIIGVHAPEFEFEKTKEHVQAAVDRFGLKYPIVLDNDMFIWRSFDNHYWPAKYLFSDGARLLDHRGGDLGGANTRAKYHHYGEGEYRQTELQIQELLRAAGVKAEFPPPMKPVRELDGVAARGAVCYPVTHELYTNRRGWHQDQWGHDVEFFRSRRYPAHEDVGVYSEGRAYLRGTWQLTEQYARHPVTTKEYEDFLLIRYKAVEVNAVIHLHAGKGPVRVKVTLDGKPLPKAKAGADVVIDAAGDSFLEVSEPRMYNIVNSKEWGIHNLALYPRDDGFAVYAFTFGSCLKPEARPLFGLPLPNPEPAPPAPNAPRTP